ncbi:hypothetical protein [Propionicimonas sp.]|uniref:hypothetical protein n=1 Tax=Propionicimonas sp. TaxID=1955623 RepID=UPI001827EE84|nr:hypothetical protein [Propionicimonas sp.]MBA3019688.1 hypothetical protein [Propionicimonas sp.]MBU4207967.1 hypothetical protein [Actinomycetota bacterium]MBU4411494.1 hypothetical protein [Actinomycetota bacterium]MCG2805806.1 hypothetical protein [Propionicimonas sp.]
MSTKQTLPERFASQTWRIVLTIGARFAELAGTTSGVGVVATGGWVQLADAVAAVALPAAASVLERIRDRQQPPPGHTER